MIWLFAGIIALLSYLIGSVNSSIILSKIMGAKDIREEGSGNAGATNMLRTHGKKAGALTLVFDMLKGIVTILVAILFTYLLQNLVKPDHYSLMSSMVEPTVFGQRVSNFELFYLLPNFQYIAAVFVVLGHDFPVFFGFKGGKGIATSAAVILMLDWKVGLIIVAFALLIMLISRYVSLASVAASVAYPLVLAAFMLGQGSWNWVYFTASVLLGLIAILRHKANIKRLLNGTESKLGQKKEGIVK